MGGYGQDGVSMMVAVGVAVGVYVFWCHCRKLWPASHGRLMNGIDVNNPVLWASRLLWNSLGSTPRSCRWELACNLGVKHRPWLKTNTTHGPTPSQCWHHWNDSRPVRSHNALIITPQNWTNIASGNGLVPASNKQLPEVMLTFNQVHWKRRCIDLLYVVASGWWRHQMEIFPRYTGPFWVEPTGHRWIPLTNASDAVLWWFFLSAPGQRFKQAIETQVIWDTNALIMTSLYCLSRCMQNGEFY